MLAWFGSDFVFFVGEGIVGSSGYLLVSVFARFSAAPALGFGIFCNFRGLGDKTLDLLSDAISVARLGELCAMFPFGRGQVCVGRVVKRAGVSRRTCRRQTSTRVRFRHTWTGD